MIPTSTAHGAARSPAGAAAPVRRRRRLGSALALAAVLAACTNSKLVVGPLYDRLDERMEGSFAELAEFDEAQRTEAARRIDRFHLWHRRSELPRYAALLERVAASIGQPGATTDDDVAGWLAEVEARATALRECHPVNFSADLIRGFSDAQLDAIERTLAERRAERREKHASRTREERLERRQKNAEKWAGRLGVELTAEQRAMLRTALESQISLRREYRALSDAWREETFRVMRERAAADYGARLEERFARLWRLLEEAHPEEWRHNRELWRGFALRFVASMTPGQRAAASAWMTKMATTLEAISDEEVARPSDDDPALGCPLDGAAPTGAAAADAPASG